MTASNVGFRDFTTIRNSAISFIDGRLSGIRTEAGEPIVDLIDAVATEQARFYSIAEYIRRINSIDGWRSVVQDEAFKTALANALNVSTSTLDPSLARTLGVPSDLSSDIEAIIFFDLNRFAVSYAKPRRDATFSTSTERFYLSSSSPYTMLRGAVVKTPGADGVSYSTTDDLFGIAPSFDPVANSYFVDTGIRSRVAGVAGNQIIGAIKAQSQTLPNVIRVTNIVIAEGGLERESNDDLLNRLESSFTGGDVNTESGILNFIESQTDVFDAVVVGPGHPLMTRAPAGAVDVYIIGSRLVTTRIRTVIATAGEALVLPYQPLRNMNSATNITNPATYVPGTGMQVLLDSGDFANSAQGNDKVIWDPSTGPQPGETVEISFTYNGVLRDVQQQLDSDPEHSVPASSILLKEGFQRGVIISMQLIVVPGQEQATVEKAVQDKLNAFLSVFVLGQLVEFSELIAQAQFTTVEGIRAVDRIENFKIGLLGDVVSVNDITMDANAYARLYRVDFISESGTIG